MLVAVIGNYGSNNLGDDMYLHLLRKAYPKHEFLPHFELRDRTPGFLLYGGGGLLRADDTRRELLEAWAARFKVPYAVFSVGATSPKMTLDRTAFPDAEFITVRDRIAAAAIGPRAIVVPDLAWVHEPAPRTIEATHIGIMIRHSSAHNSFDLVVRCRQMMEAAGPDEPFLFFHTYGRLVSDRTLEFPTAAGFAYDRDVYTGARPDVYLENYRRCTRAIVMPLHGIIFAAIYGVPWASWSYSCKVDWLADELSARVARTLSEPLVINRTDPKRVEEMRAGAREHFRLLDPYLA